jgi:hypothetical protein
MTKEKVLALFLLGGFEVINSRKITNQYWGEVVSTRKIANQYWADPANVDPWWVVKTNFGSFTIGWRKRVMDIDWTDTELTIGSSVDRHGDILKPITTDDVTMSPTNIHASGYGKAVEYLQILRHRMFLLSLVE